MRQYLDMLRRVLNEGEEKGAARNGMPTTRELWCQTMNFDLQEGFPLLTTKRVSLHNVVGELLWFLRGDTNIGYLVDHRIHIWDDDAYRYYLECGGKETKDEFLAKVGQPLELGPNYHRYGDCGKVYGYYWPSQLRQLIQQLKQSPNSRRHILSAWIPQDIGCQALPPCHVYLQCNVRQGRFLDLMFMMRSNDLFLGCPYNIASYALLTHILAKQTGLIPGRLSYVGNSVHLYSNHFEQARQQLERTPRALPRLNDFPLKDIAEYEITDFSVEGYDPYPAIKAPLSVGI